MDADLNDARADGASAAADLRSQLAQLVAEVDNLNSLINGIEKEMLKLKKRRDHTRGHAPATPRHARGGEARATAGTRLRWRSATTRVSS